MDKYEMLRQVSRTFALSIEQLPGILRDAFTLAYLLLRVSDCLEDNEALPAVEKPGLLRLWGAVLKGEEDVGRLLERISNLNPEGDAEVYVAQHAGYILDELGRLPADLQTIIIEHVFVTSIGMARWQEHGPFVENEEEMDDYMFLVAGNVGYLLTRIFSWNSPLLQKQIEKLLPLSREYGLGLQTVNIIRGLRKDYERGWVYVPRTFFEKAGLTRDGLFAPDNLDKSLQVIEMLAEKAERHLANGMTFITTFPFFEHRIRLACMWPLLFAVKTLAVSRKNANVILSEGKITRKQVGEIILKTRLFGWSNTWLFKYLAELSNPA